MCVFDGAPHWDHLLLAAHLHVWRSGLKSGRHSLPTATVCVQYVGVFACALKLFYLFIYLFLFLVMHWILLSLNSDLVNSSKSKDALNSFLVWVKTALKG